MGIGAVIAGVRAAALRLRSHHVGAKGAPFTASRRRQAPSLFRRTVTPDRFLCPVSWSPGPPSRNKSTIFVPRFPILTSAGLRRRAPADDLPPLQALPTEFLALPGLHLPPTGPLFCAEPPRGSRRRVRAARDRLLGRPADRFRALDTPLAISRVNPLLPFPDSTHTPGSHFGGSRADHTRIGCSALASCGSDGEPLRARRMGATAKPHRRAC